jgi:hypothetical protein
LREEGGGRHYQAVVPGTLLDWAALRGSDGACSLFLLAAPEGAPNDLRALYRLDLEGRRLHLLGDDLAADFDRLAARGNRLILGAPGRLAEAIPRSHGLDLEPLLDLTGLDLGAMVPVRGAPAERDRLTLPRVGRLHRLAAGSGGSWTTLEALPLPTAAVRHRRGVRLTSPPATLLRLGDGDVYAIGPEPVGDRRLRTVLRRPDAGQAQEAWSRLPGREHLQWSWFDVLDGRPILVVTTNSADKLGVFERQRLRLFTLYDDRTRAGVGPWLVAETTSRRWQRVEPFVADLDADGDQDLVIAQVDGLGGGGVALEAFVNSGRRGFEAARRRASIDTAADGWHFGSDLTGDGLPDLVLVGAGEIAVHETAAPGHGRRLVARRPRWVFAGADIPRASASVEVGRGGVVARQHDDPSATPRLLDLDGDGRDEILVADRPRWGFGRLRVVFLPPPVD